MLQVLHLWPATSLLDETNPDWLPILKLGHSKEASESRVKAAEMRWERAKVRESLKVTEDIGETNAENTVDLGPVDESTQTELTCTKALISKK